MSPARRWNDNLQQGLIRVRDPAYLHRHPVWTPPPPALADWAPQLTPFLGEWLWPGAPAHKGEHFSFPGCLFLQRSQGRGGAEGKGPNRVNGVLSLDTRGWRWRGVEPSMPSSEGRKAASPWRYQQEDFWISGLGAWKDPRNEWRLQKGGGWGMG